MNTSTAWSGFVPGACISTSVSVYVAYMLLYKEPQIEFLYKKKTVL